MKHKKYCYLMLPLFVLPLPGFAAASCTSTATPIAFGAYDPLSASNANATGIISLSCTSTNLLNLGPSTVSFDITLSKGIANSYATRQMANNINTANRLNYNLYTSTNYSTVWGDGTGGSSKVSGTGTFPANLLGIGSNIVINTNVYGRIPGATQRTVKIGSYSDNIIVTVTYQ